MDRHTILSTPFHQQPDLCVSRAILANCAKVCEGLKLGPFGQH